MNPILKSDKNPNLTIKDSNLYKLEFTVALPKQFSKRTKDLFGFVFENCS